jgi:hypothetical protein
MPRAVRAAKAAAAVKVDPALVPEQLVGLKEEGNGHDSSTGPFVVVKTEGLAAATALNGTAERPGRRARKVPAAVAPDHTEPSDEAQAPSKKGNGAALAAAIRAVAAAKSEAGPAQAAVEGMPDIPTAKPGRKRAAAKVTPATASEEPVAAAEVAAAKGSRAVRKAASARKAPAAAAAAKEEAGVGGRRTRAPRAAKAAAQGTEAVKEASFASPELIIFVCRPLRLKNSLVSLKNVMC